MFFHERPPAITNNVAMRAIQAREDRKEAIEGEKRKRITENELIDESARLRRTHC